LKEVAFSLLIPQTSKVRSSYVKKFVLKRSAFFVSKLLTPLASVFFVNKNFKVVFLSLKATSLSESSLTLQFRLASG
jgi:hypothetical protein